MEAMNSLLVAGLLCGLFGAGGGPGSQGPILRTCWNNADADHCDSCGGGCAPCGDPCYEPCCPPVRLRSCHDRTYYGPLTFICSLFGAGRGAGCWSTTGCGERYWGDFYSSPPDLCDPCDRCGNYNPGPNYGSYDGGYGGVQAEPRYVNPGVSGGMISTPNSQPERTISPAPRPAEPIPYQGKPIQKTTRRPVRYRY
jgi:hypothetical protein